MIGAAREVGWKFLDGKELTSKSLGVDTERFCKRSSLMRMSR